MAPQRDVAQGELFTRLLLKHQRRIYGLILSLVPNGPDADDILQEACSVMWNKFDEFEPGTNFSAWALRIARWQVMAHYTRHRRNRARLSDENLDALVERLASRPDRQDERTAVLDGCLEQLDVRDRRILAMRYRDNTSVEEAARLDGRSVHAVYKLLARLHDRLLECVKGKLSPEAAR